MMLDPPLDPLPDLRPISLLTGFLGSGKTTLLNRLLANPMMGDAAVLINEFGDVALDHLLVETIDDEIMVLETGCVCCTPRDDLSETLLALFARRQAGDTPDFRRILLETTGLADPAPILQQIMTHPALAALCRPGPLITVVDTVYGPATLDRHLEAVRQVALADRLVLSKTDLDPAKAARSALVARLGALNPGADILTCNEAAAHPQALFAATPDRPADQPALTAARGPHDHRFASFTISWEASVVWAEFEAWLSGLLAVRGDSIYRLKGLLNVAGKDRPVVVQGVQHSLYPPGELAAWPTDAPRTQLVFITQDFSPAAALASLRPFFPLAEPTAS